MLNKARYPRGPHGIFTSPFALRPHSCIIAARAVSLPRPLVLRPHSCIIASYAVSLPRLFTLRPQHSFMLSFVSCLTSSYVLYISYLLSCAFRTFPQYYLCYYQEVYFCTQNYQISLKQLILKLHFSKRNCVVLLWGSLFVVIRKPA